MRALAWIAAALLVVLVHLRARQLGEDPVGAFFAGFVLAAAAFLGAAWVGYRFLV